MAEGSTVYKDMIAVMSKGANSPEAQAIVERWRKHMDYFWTPNLEQLLGLANGYNDDPIADFFRGVHQRVFQMDGSLAMTKLKIFCIGIALILCMEFCPILYEEAGGIRRNPRIIAGKYFNHILG